MITCIKCNFKVNNKMRFSIAKNFCPSCGSNLLSDATFNEINAVNKKLQSQDFIVTLSNQLNKELVQNLVYDLSIFFKFELERMYKTETSYSSPGEVSQSSSSEENDFSEDDEVGEIIDEESQKAIHKPIARSQILSSIREEVRREVSEEPDEDDDFEEGDEEEIDERVARLKKAYENSPTLKKTFKGISRIGS